MRLPLRARLALVSTLLMALVLAGVGAFVYLRVRADLLATVDAGLRSKAEAFVAVSDRPEDLVAAAGSLAERDEAFVQILDPSGAVVAASPPSLLAEPLIPPGGRVSTGGSRIFERSVPTGEERVPARLLAVGVADGRLVIIGASLDEQHEALAGLATSLLVGGPIALALIAGVGWLLAGSALRPVERMREEAAAISASEPGRRLPVPPTRDEVSRLGETLNDMLTRLEEALARERRFVDDASHELRTPLANLRTELELALRRARSTEELEDVIRSAAEETQSLARLAEDLLVLARADRGRLPVRVESVDLTDLVGTSVEPFRARADARGVTIESTVPAGTRAEVDPMRIRQALGNLLDNALRQSPTGGRVVVEADRRGADLALEVRDEGPGFPAEFVDRAFEPFARPDASRTRPDGGAGLGLAIVRAVAHAHGGSAVARNIPGGGASVTVLLPADTHGPLIDVAASSPRRKETT